MDKTHFADDATLAHIAKLERENAGLRWALGRCADTPETDALVNALKAGGGTDYEDMFVMEQHGRKLERQRNKLREALEAVLDAEDGKISFDEYVKKHRHGQLFSRAKARAVLQEVGK
jgi:hypothetical protein